MADTDSNDTDKLNDVHFDGFVDSNRKFSISPELNITKPEVVFVLSPNFLKKHPKANEILKTGRGGGVV